MVGGDWNRVCRGATVKEKEVRLALVCYGGVSLAVYMHGVTKEILKLARGSTAYHSVSDAPTRTAMAFGDIAGVADRPGCDTESVYFDLLKAIGRHLDLRVIVDVIAGASAGGINGVILARALAHDLSVEGLRQVWLAEADVDRLLARKRKARPWSKVYLWPLIWGYTQGRLYRVVPRGEIRGKLSTLIRSRWFKPPFDGAGFSSLLFDAIDGMGNPPHDGASLLPVGHSLELFVTLTDFFGFLQHIPIHDPPLVSEREHRHTLRFEARRGPSGEGHSDFERANVPALVFAARATSSFPGAFPPTQIAEIDRMIAAKGLTWETRQRFLERNFRFSAQADMNPTKTSFIDGSVLNNKPFAEAIQSIKGRPAYRQVDRRLVYIDPHPTEPSPPADGRPPGFFRTLKGALSDIPRNEPIYENLAWIEGFNVQVRRLKTIIDAARPDIGRMVAAIAQGALDAPFTQDRIRQWRDAANARAVRDAGFVYDGYLRLKLAAVLEFLNTMICGLCGYAESSPAGRGVAATIDRWARCQGIHPETASGNATSTIDPQPPWIGFLLAFDIGFRRRRIRFVIRALNLLYGRLREPTFAGVTAAMLDGLKSELYDALEVLRHYDDGAFVTAGTAARMRELFPPMAVAAGRETVADPESMDVLVRELAGQIDLLSINQLVDGLFADLSPDQWSEAARHELLISYVGFAFWDVLTFSLAHWRNLDEFDEIRVDRISPSDATTIRSGDSSATLRGVTFAHFGAFFSRQYRENDYLWGRLHAAERLIDIVCDAAALEGASADLDVRGFKKHAFELVLDSEERHLPDSRDLIATLRREVERL